MEHLQHLIIGLVDRYGYGGLFVALVLGNVGAPVGSEIVLPVSGGLTATGHLTALWLTIAVAVIGELVGQTIAYAVGRFGGVPVLERFGKYVGFHHEQMERFHRFIERYGTFAVFICRFLPVIRGVCGFPAGIAEMNLAHFYLWTFLGSAIFCTLLVSLGFAFGDHLNAILPLLHRGGTVVAIVAILAIVAGIVWYRSRSRKRGGLARAEGDPTLG
jgi:membrane protein DedA with SNARE-associated domain